MQKNAKTPRSHRRAKWIGGIAGLLAVILAAGLLLWPGQGALTGTAQALATVEKPKTVPYPQDSDYFKTDGSFDDEGYLAAYNAWLASRPALMDEAQRQALADFITKSVPVLLRSDADSNAVYSPLNVYLALAMLAETTDGDSQQQLLDLLGAAELASLRTEAEALWRANYIDDGHSSSLLANSLWLNEDVSFNQSVLDSLAKNYYAESFQGTMGAEKTNKLLRDWINRQTNDLLKGQTDGLELSRDTVLALVSTLYFKAAWTDEFNKTLTAPDTFTNAEGKAETCDFLHESDQNILYRGSQFTAVEKSLQNGGGMWLIRPNEGVTTDALLGDAELTQFLLANGAWEDADYAQINLSLPKFDVTGEADLRGGLQQLGVTDVFAPGAADFSPLCGAASDGRYVSKLQHDARVLIDEEGCTAAAFTIASVEATCAEEDLEEIDFTLDRPFLFAITNADGLPLFTGIVNTTA